MGAALCALVLAGLVIGSSIALVALGSTPATATLSPGYDREIEVGTGAGSHETRIGTKGITSGTSTRPVPSLRSAGRFFLTELRQKLRGDWAKAWQNLYPLHQRIAPRDSFIRCETATPFPAPLESVHIVRVRAAPVHVAGALRPVPGAAVTVAVELRWYGPRDPITATHTFHLVPVHGRWTWLLSPDHYRLYLQGACFAEPAL